MIARVRQLMSAEDGLGLIEVVVAMFMLAVLSLMLLPTLISGMKLAVSNTTIAAATQLANDRISIAHDAAPSCSAVVAAVNGDVDSTDARGVELRAATTVTGTCPAAGRAETLNVTTTVTRLDDGKVVAEASTLVLVAEP